jgi:type I restriction enzyme S subunit
MSWQTVKLGDVMTVGRGSSPRPIKDERFFTGGTIPWVKIADATASGKFIYQTNQHVNDYGASFSTVPWRGSVHP